MTDGYGGRYNGWNGTVMTDGYGGRNDELLQNSSLTHNNDPVIMYAYLTIWHKHDKFGIIYYSIFEHKVQIN
jgi:hypothetical protein